MKSEEAQKLREEWKQFNKDKECSHPHFEKEYFNGSATGDKVCTTCGEEVYEQESIVDKKEKFIKELLDKAKEKKGFISIELKISELSNFDLPTAEELSKVTEYVMTKETSISETNYKGRILSFSIEDDYIAFIPEYLEKHIP